MEEFIFYLGCEGDDRRKEVRNCTAQLVKHVKKILIYQQAGQHPSFLSTTLQQNGKCNQPTTIHANTTGRKNQYVGCVVLRILEFQGMQKLKVFSSTCVRKMRQSTSQSSESFSIQRSYQPNTVVRGYPKKWATT